MTSIRNTFGNPMSEIALSHRALQLYLRMQHVEKPDPLLYPAAEPNSVTPMFLAAIEHQQHALYGRKPKPFTSLIR